MFVKVKFGKYILLNQFLSNGFFLYILKVSENKKFSDVLRGDSKGNIEKKGVKKWLQIIPSVNFRSGKSLVIFLKNWFFVPVCCYFINNVLINHAFRRSTKFSRKNVSERNTAFIRKNEIEFCITLPLFLFEFLNFFRVLKNYSFEKGCGRKSSLWKRTKNHIRYLWDKMGRKRRWLWKAFYKLLHTYLNL